MLDRNRFKNFFSLCSAELQLQAVKGHKCERALYGLIGHSFVTLQKTLFLGNIPGTHYHSLAECTPLFQKR